MSVLYVRNKDGTFSPVTGGGGSGAAGQDGGYYVPSVSDAGDLNWAASKAGMPAVAGVNIKGEKGDKGATGPQGPQGATGAQGEKGDTGESGVYILTDGETVEDAPEYARVIIDPNGEADSSEGETVIPGVSQDSTNAAVSVGLSITGATVGQTVKVAAVDENGVPTAWEPVDFPDDDHINELINTALEAMTDASEVAY